MKVVSRLSMNFSLAALGVDKVMVNGWTDTYVFSHDD
jgi:hypothetical protein